MERLSRLAAIAAVVASLAPIISHSSSVPDHGRGMAQAPRLLLWAWERPEDLRFIDSDHVGVAFLAGTIRLRAGATDYRPRLQPLRVSPQAKLVAVIRIETTKAQLNLEQLQRTVRELVGASALPQVAAIQIDFDATLSERVFYRELLVELRRQLPSSLPISITALASWCIGDDWMADLPIDEAVPMLFRLGTGTNEVTSWIGSERDFQQPLCRGSLGVSTDEPWTLLPSGRRVYAFSPKPWTEHSLAALYWEMHSWH